jgi:hypothetical protein
LFVAMAVAGVMLVGSSAAKAEDSGFSIRLNGTWTKPDTPYLEPGNELVRLNTTTSESFGLALSGEYRFAERIGLEVGVQAFNESEIVIRQRDPQGGIVGDELDPHPQDDTRFTLYDAALNIYIVSGGLDLYAGPVFGFFTFTDLDVQATPFLVPAKVEIDGDYALGVVVGLDVEFPDSPWFFTSSIKYLDSDYELSLDNSLGVRSPQEIDFDPWIFRLGLGFRI